MPNDATYFAFMLGMCAAACLIGMGAALAICVEDVRVRRLEARQLQRENDRLDKVVRAAEGIAR